MKELIQETKDMILSLDSKGLGIKEIIKEMEDKGFLITKPQIGKILIDKKEMKIFCPKCQSENVIKSGHRLTQIRGLIQKYTCKDCNRRNFSIDKGDYRNRKITIPIKKRIVHFYENTSLSTRKISEKIKKEFDIEISHTGISRCINKEMNSGKTGRPPLNLPEKIKQIMIKMYSKGKSTRDIGDYLNEVCEFNIGYASVNNWLKKNKIQKGYILKMEDIEEVEEMSKESPISTLSVSNQILTREDNRRIILGILHREYSIEETEEKQDEIVELIMKVCEISKC